MTREELRKKFVDAIDQLRGRKFVWAALSVEDQTVIECFRDSFAADAPAPNAELDDVVARVNARSKTPSS